MAIGPEDLQIIRMEAQRYLQERTDNEVERHLRPLKSIATIAGVLNISALVALFLTLPSIASSRLMSDLASLTGDITKIVGQAQKAQTQAELAKQTVESSLKSAAEAEQRAADAEKLYALAVNNAEAANQLAKKLSQFTYAEIESKVDLLFDDKTVAANLQSDISQLKNDVADLRDRSAGFGGVVPRSAELGVAYSERSHGFVLASVECTGRSGSHGSLVLSTQSVRDGSRQTTSVARNEWSQSSGGTASVLLPVQLGDEWIVELGTYQKGVNPRLQVWWIPLQ